MTTGFFSPSYKDTKMIAFHEGKIHQVEGFEMLVVNKTDIDVVTKQNINDHQLSYHGMDNIATEVNGEKFSILCLDVDAEYEWVQYEKETSREQDYNSLSSLPKAAVLAGIYNDNAFFIGRGRVQDQLLLGMFLPKRTRNTDKYEDVSQKLYVINKEDMKINHVEKFEVLVCRPAAWTLSPGGEEQADTMACNNKTLEEISPDNLEEDCENIKAAITSPTDSMIGADFQGLTAEQQKRQREEWKAELKKTEEEILTFKQVLTTKERHAAGLKRCLGITAWREFSGDMTQGLKNLQESVMYKRTAENLQFAKDIAKEKTSEMMTGIAASGYFQSMGAKMGEVYVAAKTKMTTSMSQQTFDEALNEHNVTTPAASEPAEKSPQ